MATIRTGTASQAHSPANSDRPMASWLLLIWQLPAAVAVLSGWVGLGQLTESRQFRPLPGIWNTLRLNTAVNLPVAVEA